MAFKGEIPIRTLLDPNFLRSQAHWIRNILDPVIARDGPEALSVDSVLSLDSLLRKLTVATLPLDTIRAARIHLAIMEIAGRATRWPHRIIERAETVAKAWESRFGPLAEVGIELLGPGGRLRGIVDEVSIGKERMLIKWLKEGVKLSPARARKWGELGFKAGDWWINPLFAFRDGIIDSGDPNGGITADADGAYALLMTDEDELESPTPEHFVYRTRNHDRGRYRLTAGSPNSWEPIRVLRSHTLRSLWSPRAGVRYEGLYRVKGWSIYLDKKTHAMTYDVTFDRLPSEPDINEVLCRPWAEELEDYKEYKRLRKEARDQEFKGIQPTPTFVLTTTDGTVEDCSPRDGENASAERVDFQALLPELFPNPKKDSVSLDEEEIPVPSEAETPATPPIKRRGAIDIRSDSLPASRRFSVDHTRSGTASPTTPYSDYMSLAPELERQRVEEADEWLAAADYVLTLELEKEEKNKAEDGAAQ